MFLLLLILFGSVSSDRLSFHLKNLIDRNVSPCDDFYHHVCSQHVDPKEFFINRATTLFDNAIENLKPDAIKYSPIEYDKQQLKSARNLSEIEFVELDYARLVSKRCERDIFCYMNDILYFLHQMGSMKLLFNETILDEFDGDISDEEVFIDKMIAFSSELIREILKFIQSSEDSPHKTLLAMALSFHTTLQTRIRVIEFMQTNGTHDDFHEIKDIAESMKRKMIGDIQSSKWLKGDEISEFIRSKIIKRIESIEIFHDFDEYDKNITTLLKINRDFNGLYFSVQSETGIPQLDMLLKQNYAYTKLASDKNTSNYINRIMGNFDFNAFFHNEMKTVTILAPFIHKSAFQSNILKEPFITYWFLGHELYHSLFSKAIPNLFALYNHRSTCISNHYAESCKKFGMGSCGSGNNTITEDAPDLESYRTLYSLLQDKYSKKQLKTKIKGLKTTLEQAFFYYVASGFCDKDVIRSEEEAKDVHSADNIRVNAPFSLMPEFTKAFGCKKEDAMYVEEKDSCYVFGPKSQFAL